ncbi:XRN 5'-3' exonuclease [Nitzschia inconspicua]|uniref:5'-3' exoribonuclease 1 n=1 Tax=Nitzschia inconspicua TaxID=303405 RepID=A0A9K3LMM6_9STRA|nr:XRN 5'-3' exonuclease [Nitzschia inconspicua]
MGVPKFYRWISERYTKINEIVSDSALLPEFDHLYLDMNGIIHGCTHPSHLDLSDVLSERDMMLGIMHYLDRIITQIVKPRVSVYMAIDGVAPRAKLNQQRSRRFRAAKDMAEATKDMAKERDEAGNLKSPNVFDSNCITPGTEFMARVSETIKYFIRKKIKEDPIWRDLKIIFSGQEIPGEGEHKIMEHIRMMRSQPGYQPNTRHCIYGQDADLIMLGLVTHEPHFTILREVIDFSSGFVNKNTLQMVKKYTKESDFQLLHLSVLREYLYLEFCRDSPPGTVDLERTIDDFVFMTFLVGNDFLPHLNTLDIGEGAFDLLFKVYKEQRPGWGAGQYLTKSGDISDPARLEAFLAAIGSVETETLEEREKNDAEYVKKKRQWNKRDGMPQGPSDAEIKAVEDAKQNDYLSMMNELMSKHKNDTFIDGWTPVNPGEKDFKGRYYFEKLKLTPLDIKEHHALRQAYIEGLMWCLAYYYRGCISWGWFYPYHYGPMLSDLRNLPEMFKRINFTLGKPILPFQQLMSCLPPASSSLLPMPFKYLMTSPDSPIIHFYPVDFEVDMNGKKNPWEGVNLLPFIEIDLLLDTIAKYVPDEKLTPAERNRNRVGEIFFYTFDMTATETVEAPHKGIGLTDIVKCHSRVTIMPEYESYGVSFKPELIPGTQIPYPGFPSLNVLPIADAELVPIGVKVFGFPSKYSTMVLRLHKMPEVPPVETLADNLLDKSLFINWPMMHEAKVTAISDSKTEIRLYKGKKKSKKWNKMEEDRWATESEEMMQNYLGGTNIPGSGGVEIGEVKIRLRLLPLQGMKTNPGNGSTKKLFGKEEAEVPLQLALWQAPAPDPRFVERGPRSLSDRFPSNCNVVLTKGKYRGCIGLVVGVADNKSVGVKVLTMPPEVPFGLALARSVYESYISSADAARILKINPALFGRITSSLIFSQGGYDLGLNLKSQEGLCVAGYTRKKREVATNGFGNPLDEKKAWDSGDSLLVIGSSRTVGNTEETHEERIQWEYTPKAIRLVNEYRQKFPQLFNALTKLPSEKKYDANQVFGPNGVEWLAVIRDWLNNLDSAKLPRVPISTDTMSQEAVIAVEKAADVRNLAIKKKGFPKESLIKIPGSALYRENSTGPTDVMLASDHNDNEAPELGDRIVNLCASGIPFGARGTVVGIHKATTGCVEVVMDEEFVGGTNLQGLCSNFRGKLAVWAHLMRITVENNQVVVDRLAPQGSGKANVNKILADIEKQVTNDNKAANVPVALPPKNAPAKASLSTSTPSRHVSTGRNRAVSSGKSRSESTAKDRQAGWREAKGPPEKGIGFKSRKGKNGLNRWKNFINGKKKPAAAAPAQSVTSKATELKAILGVTPSPASNLKAMLGVGAAPAAPSMSVPPPQPSADPAAGLKALLGVGATSTPVPVPAQNPMSSPPLPPPPSAADKLMQLMVKQQYPSQSIPPPLPAVSAFNFSYTEEGKEAPEPPIVSMGPPPMPPQVMGMGFPPPPPVPMMSPYGYLPHPGMPPMMGHPGMMQMGMGMPPQQIPFLNSGGGLPVLSDKDFPPIGGPSSVTSDKAQQQK